MDEDRTELEKTEEQPLPPEGESLPPEGEALPPESPPQEEAGKTEKDRPPRKPEKKPVRKEQSEAWLRFRAQAGAVLRRVGRAVKKAAGVAARHFAAWVKANFAMPPREALGTLWDGLRYREGRMALALGLCMALFPAVTLQRALALGLVFLGVLVPSALTVSFLRCLLPERLRFPVSMVVSALFATLAGLVLDRSLPLLSLALGIFVPLMAVNWAVLERLCRFSCVHLPGCAALDALGAGVSFTLLLCLIGALRELLSTGKVWGLPLCGGMEPVLGAGELYGGFLLLGTVLAVGQLLGRFLGRLGERRGRK